MAKKDTTPAAPKMTPCECQYWQVGPELSADDPNIDNVPIYKTSCTGEQTARMFVPGHDAKLKSLLIRAGVAGWDVRRIDGTMHTMDAITAGSRFGFGHQVREGVARKLKQAEATTERKAKRAAEKAEAKPPREVPVKVVEPPAKADDETTREAREADSKAYHKELADSLKQDQTKDATPDTPKLPDGQVVKIKLGRYTYDAVIDNKGNATYINSKQMLMDAAKGIYKLVK